MDERIADQDKHLQALTTARLGLVLAQEMHHEHGASDTARMLEEAEKIYNEAYDWFVVRGFQPHYDGKQFTLS